LPLRSDIRTSYGMFFDRGEDDVIAAVEQRLSEWSLIPPGHGEGIQARRRAAGLPRDALPALAVHAPARQQRSMQPVLSMCRGSTVPLTCCAQVLRYENGEEYKPHFGEREEKQKLRQPGPTARLQQLGCPPAWTAMCLHTDGHLTPCPTSLADYFFGDSPPAHHGACSSFCCSHSSYFVQALGRQPATQHRHACHAPAIPPPPPQTSTV
jgi:hypothetical protein